jgi:ketosteroid isomerase-like protein
VLVLGLLAGEAVGQRPASPADLQEALLAQETKLIEAINKKDKASITALLANEAMSITSRGRQTTQQIIDALEEISFSGYQIDHPTTFSVSPEVAILTYTFSWTGESAGQAPTATRVYATSVWQRRDRKWRSVFYQETPIAAK